MNRSASRSLNQTIRVIHMQPCFVEAATSFLQNQMHSFTEQKCQKRNAVFIQFCCLDFQMPNVSTKRETRVATHGSNILSLQFVALFVHLLKMMTCIVLLKLAKLSTVAQSFQRDEANVHPPCNFSFAHIPERNHSGQLAQATRPNRRKSQVISS